MTIDAFDQLQEITVTAERLSLIGSAVTASEGVVVNDELALTPVYRPGQMLETVPEAKSKARRTAFLASRINTLLSIPMLFFMSASGGVFRVAYFNF